MFVVCDCGGSSWQVDHEWGKQFDIEAFVMHLVCRDCGINLTICPAERESVYDVMDREGS